MSLDIAAKIVVGRTLEDVPVDRARIYGLKQEYGEDFGIHNVYEECSTNQAVVGFTVFETMYWEPKQIYVNTLPDKVQQYKDEFEKIFGHTGKVYLLPYMD